MLLGNQLKEVYFLAQNKSRLCIFEKGDRSAALPENIRKARNHSGYGLFNQMISQELYKKSE